MIRELEKCLYAACIQNGLGTAKGTLAGMLAAELACGVESEALDRALSAPLPPKPAAQIGAWLRIRYSEAKSLT